MAMVTKGAISRKRAMASNDDNETRMTETMMTTTTTTMTINTTRTMTMLMVTMKTTTVWWQRLAVSEVAGEGNKSGGGRG
jgi:hypothetical protein